MEEMRAELGRLRAEVADLKKLREEDAKTIAELRWAHGVADWLVEREWLLRGATAGCGRALLRLGGHPPERY